MLAGFRSGSVHGGRFGRNVPWELDVNQKRWRALAGGVSRRALHLAAHPLQLAASPITDPVFNDQTCRPSPPLSPCLRSPSQTKKLTQCPIGSSTFKNTFHVLSCVPAWKITTIMHPSRMLLQFSAVAAP